MRTICFVVVVALAGCATATPYQPKGRGGGYSETQLSENVFQVHFQGNGHTRDERAEDFTLLRSAELAEEHGYSYFIVVDEKSGASYSTFTAPTQTNATASASMVGNTAYGSAHSTTTGGQTYTVRKPSERNTIVCFKDKPEGQGLVYEAKFVDKSVREKYGLPDQ